MEEYQIIKFNGKEYKVVKHWFWDEFVKSFWEERTYKIFERYIDKDTSYIDVGAWIGATMIYASQFTEKTMFGIEANPLSCGMLFANCKALDCVITHCCITDKDDEKIGFGGKDNQENTSSASSIYGDCWQVSTKTLLTYLSKNKLLEGEKLFIKIDIEGAEELIWRDLKFLRYLADGTIYLSIHPPFMKDKKTFCDNLLSFCYEFKHVLDSNMKILPAEKLKEMILTEMPYPSWGTSYGNFFEIVLTNKGV